LESVAAIQAEMSANSSAWDLTKNPTKLAHRPVFIVSAINKNDPAALAKALRDAGAKQVAFYDWKTDHGMQDRRIEAARTLVGWLHADCRIGGR
jgi:hypothetical protein